MVEHDVIVIVVGTGGVEHHWLARWDVLALGQPRDDCHRAGLEHREALRVGPLHPVGVGEFETQCVDPCWQVVVVPVLGRLVLEDWRTEQVGVHADGEVVAVRVERAPEVEQHWEIGVDLDIGHRRVENQHRCRLVDPDHDLSDVGVTRAVLDGECDLVHALGQSRLEYPSAAHRLAHQVALPEYAD